MLKHADVKLVHKKKEKTDKANYKPASILPNISKIYEKLMYQQLYDHFESVLSPKQCGFRKGHSAQNCLMVMLKKFGALFTDLSKEFDCIDHNLLTTKLFWYGVTTKSLNLIYSYLRNRTQSVRINKSYSNKREIMYGVPQGSVLGPLLFNIDLIDLFLECEDDNINSYADDTTPYSCAEDMSSVFTDLQRIANKIFRWFQNNHMKANPGKSRVLLTSNIQLVVPFDNVQITSSLSKKLLGITFDSELKFEEHVSKVCNIVNKKLNDLHCIVNQMSLDKRKMLLNALIESQFSYCPLIWMFHSRTLNNKINRLHEKALRIVYADFKANFDELLEKDSSFSIHHRNIQKLPIETFKFLNGIFPPIMNEVFQVRPSAPYSRRDKNELYSRNPKTVTYGTESISLFGTQNLVNST